MDKTECFETKLRCREITQKKTYNKDNSLTFFCLWIGDFKTHVSVGLAAIFELRDNSVSVETVKCTAVWQLQQFSMGHGRLKCLMMLLHPLWSKTHLCAQHYRIFNKLLVDSIFGSCYLLSYLSKSWLLKSETYITVQEEPATFPCCEPESAVKHMILIRLQSPCLITVKIVIV
jgi:hypothetical protein